MSEEVKNSTTQETKEGFFKRFTGPEHPTLSIVVFNLIAMLLTLLTLFIGSNIIVPILYAACMLIPLAYVRPLGVISMVKAIACALIAGIIVAAADAGVFAMYSANIPVVSIIVVIIIWAAAHLIYFAVGAFAYKISFSKLSLPTVILFLGSILTEIIYEVGSALIFSGQPVLNDGWLGYLSMLDKMSGSSAFNIAFIAIRLLLVSLSVCVAAKYAQKLREKE